MEDPYVCFIREETPPGWLQPFKILFFFTSLKTQQLNHRNLDWLLKIHGTTSNQPKKTYQPRINPSLKKKKNIQKNQENPYQSHSKPFAPAPVPVPTPPRPGAPTSRWVHRCLPYKTGWWLSHPWRVQQDNTSHVQDDTGGYAKK